MQYTDLEQQRKYVVEKLQEQPDPEHLWECILAFQGYEFRTISGLPFTYQLKKGKNGNLTKELWIDRRKNSKSLAWSSVLKAFEKTEGRPVVVRPKALGDIRGVSYLYGIFYRFGLIEMPEKSERCNWLLYYPTVEYIRLIKRCYRKWKYW